MTGTGTAAALVRRADEQLRHPAGGAGHAATARWSPTPTASSYVDLLGGIAVNILGHAPPGDHRGRHRAAVHPRAHVEPVRHRAGRSRWPRQLLAHLGATPARVFFCNSGTEANEVAFKIARLTGRTKHHRRRERLPRPHDGCARADRPARQAGAVRADARATSRTCPYGDVDALDARRRRRHRRGVPRADHGGGRRRRAAARATWSRPGEITAEHGALLVLDEVQTGDRPHRLVLRPPGDGHHARRRSPSPRVSAAGCRSARASRIGAAADLLDARACTARTFGGNPVCTAAALAVLRTLADDDLITRADALGKTLQPRHRGARASAGRPRPRRRAAARHRADRRTWPPRSRPPRARPASWSTPRSRTSSGWRRRWSSPTTQVDGFVAALPAILDNALGREPRKQR